MPPVCSCLNLKKLSNCNNLKEHLSFDDFFPNFFVYDREHRSRGPRNHFDDDDDDDDDDD